MAWAALSIYWPMDLGMGPRALALLVLAPQAATVVLAVLALRSRAMPDVVSGRLEAMAVAR